MSFRDPTRPRHHYREPSNPSLRTPSQLDDPKDDHITYEDLGNCDGTLENNQTLEQLQADTGLDAYVCRARNPSIQANARSD